MLLIGLDAVSIGVVPSEALVCALEPRAGLETWLILWRCTKRICQRVPSCSDKLQAEMSGLNPAFLSIMFFSLTVKAPAAPE